MIETAYLILRADGGQIAHLVQLPADPGYDGIRAIVNPVLGEGADLEHVSVLYEGVATDMFVDERGHPKCLPRNEKATAIYRNNWLTKYPGTDPESLPWVAGAAVLFCRRVWF